VLDKLRFWTKKEGSEAPIKEHKPQVFEGTTTMKLQEFFQSLLQTEEKIIPLFVHNPQSQAISAVVLVAESLAVSLISQLTQKAPAAPAA